MADEVLLPGNILSLTAAAADRLLSAGNGDAALLYLCLLRAGGRYDPAWTGRTLKWDTARLATAHAALSGMGLAPREEVQTAASTAQDVDEPPEYTAADIAKELESGASSFPGLVGEVQRRLGKILSTADLKTLYTIYDYLALPAEVICLLVSFCVEEQERKYGPGRRPRLPQIRKEAFTWRRMGLDTAEAVEGYLKRQSTLRTREGAILALLGISGREAVDGERKFISAWVEMGFTDEALRLAFERTIFQKQSMSWPYMNSILKSWHQKGLHTVEDIKSRDSERRAAPTGAAAAPPPPSPQRVNDDIRWMQEFLEREKQSDKGGR